MSYDALRKAIQESGMSDLQTKLFLKQIDVVDKLHDRGNVIAAKATLLALQKQIENVSCATMKQKWGKRVCVPEKDVNRVSTMIDALVKKLEQPVKERKEEVKEKAQSWLEQLKERLRR
jgi:gas vesicle protein